MTEKKAIPVVFSHEIKWVGDDEIFVPGMTPGTTITVCRYPMSEIKTKRLVVIEQRGEIPECLEDIGIISVKTAEYLSVDFNGDVLTIINDGTELVAKKLTCMEHVFNTASFVPGSVYIIEHDDAAFMGIPLKRFVGIITSWSKTQLTFLVYRLPDIYGNCTNNITVNINDIIHGRCRIKKIDISNVVFDDVIPCEPKDSSNIKELDIEGKFKSINELLSEEHDLVNKFREFKETHPDYHCSLDEFTELTEMRDTIVYTRECIRKALSVE